MYPPSQRIKLPPFPHHFRAFRREEDESYAASFAGVQALITELRPSIPSWQVFRNRCWTFPTRWRWTLPTAILGPVERQVGDQIGSPPAYVSRSLFETHLPTAPLVNPRLRIDVFDVVRERELVH